MDTIELLGSTLGLGLLAGIRLYATVLALGLAIRFNLLHLSAQMSHLAVLSDTRVLIAAGIAAGFEFFSDKIPWVDSIWDSVHTIIRPIGGALLGATALGASDPVTKTIVALLCGGLAFTSHSSKAATRLMVNHSPEPFSNIFLSFFEDLIIPAGVWIVVRHPLIAFGIVAVFLGIFLWLAPKIFRLVRGQWIAISSFARKLAPHT